MPLLGPIAEGFDDWLAAGGFTRGSRKFSIRMLPVIDAGLRRRRVDKLPKLNQQALQSCWKALMKTYPCGAGTVHTLQRYLVANGLIVDGRASATSRPPTLSEATSITFVKFTDSPCPRFQAIGAPRSASSST
jgi:hypothetical protein